ncbi:FAD dependent oxidoreductase [Truncatella angustata]|uniref:FAD dependent oxidoreductase n=1 Tax=Truncatella angustata TaxID=152316 RepID=A0A9P8RJD0_9PEZI|nr:FAD dependent oxidoreductase [Truncatella angustata]KAH6647124.1 FAD dependent oxidoreductase [Truncatella angustata]KAH8200386.1 hypothetical protein TruAng_005475 [Truncatella angustata]
MSFEQGKPLTLWRDIDPNPRPLKSPPRSNAKHVPVIGGGITALVTAWVLLDHGYRITLVAKSWFSKTERLTSQIAGALWEYPPPVCGNHSNDSNNISRFKNWSMVGYYIFKGLAAETSFATSCGIKTVSSTFFSRSRIEDIPDKYQKMIEIQASGVQGFRRDDKILQERGIDASAGVVDTFELLAPIIDTDKALEHIMHLVRSKGARSVTESIEQDLNDIEESLLARFPAHVVVNATGLDSKVVAGDTTVSPIRGALLRFVNDWVGYPKVDRALTAPSPDLNKDQFIFLVPRNDDTLVMGGVSQSHQWDLNLTPQSPEVVQMREMCELSMPALKNGCLVEEYPLAQGLRPFREQDTRVERDTRRKCSRIIHSYAQGGSGWSWSFGCAQEVLDLFEIVIRETHSSALDCERCAAPAP